MQQRWVVNTSFIITVAVLVGAIGYLAAVERKALPPTPRQQSKTDTETSVERPQQGLNSNWETIEDTNGGYRIKYPSNLRDLLGPGVISASSKPSVLVTTKGEDFVGGCFAALPYPGGSNPPVKMNEVATGRARFCLSTALDSGPGVKFKDYFYTTQQRGKYYVVSFTVEYSGYCFVDPTSCKLFDEPSALKLFEKILSTFEFTAM